MALKLPLIIRLAIVLAFTFCSNCIKVKAQVPTPVESNISQSEQVQLSPGSGSILVVPNLINKQSHVSWAYLQAGNANAASLNWNDVSFNLPTDSLNPAIVGLVNKPGSTQFYIIYQDGTVAISTASESGVTAPAVLGRDTNYLQFAYSKLQGQNTLYMLTAGGNIDISRNGGQSWQQDTGGAPFNYFIDLAVDTFHNAYAFYSPSGFVELYKQDANSNMWSAANFPAGQSPTNLFIDRRNRFFISTYGNGVYCSTDTGNTWTQSATNINGALGGPLSDDAFGNVYLVANGGKQVYRSSDVGAHWIEIDGPVTSLEMDSSFLNIVNNVSGDSALTASTIYGEFISTDQGNSWTAVNNGLHETQFNGFYKSASGRFIETSNNGMFYIDPQATSFTHVLPAGGYGFAGPVLADTIGNIYTTTETGYLSGVTNFYWKSSNYGTSWQADTAGLSQIPAVGSFGVDEYGNEHVSTHGDFGVLLMYKKLSGSHNFALDTMGFYGMNDFFYNIEAIGSDDNGRLFIGGGGDANLLTCWSRPINGTAWVTDTAGLGGFSTITYFTHESDHNMIAIAGQGLYYHQSGRWNGIPFPVITEGSLSVNAVAADNSGGIIASFTYTSPSFLNTNGNGIYCTHDHGATWNFVGLSGVNVYSLHNFGDTTYALSDLGIFALTCSGIVSPLGIAEPENKASVNLAIYPNPTSGICHATFATLSAESKNELVIMDISGRTIRTLLITGETNEISFDTNDMNSGIYFCVLKSGGSVLEVKKLIVAK